MIAPTLTNHGHIGSHATVVHHRMGYILAQHRLCLGRHQRNTQRSAACPAEDPQGRGLFLQVPVAPFHQRDQRQGKLLPAQGEAVFVPHSRLALAMGNPLQHARCRQRLQPRAQDPARRADIAAKVVEASDAVERLADEIIVHTTIIVTPERDRVLGAYTQYGAMVDLTGLRLAHLPKDFVAGVLRQHTRGPFKAELIRRLEKEARAVPGGRFAFATRVGFGLAVEQAPFPS